MLFFLLQAWHRVKKSEFDMRNWTTLHRNAVLFSTTELQRTWMVTKATTPHYSLLITLENTWQTNILESFENERIPRTTNDWFYSIHSPIKMNQHPNDRWVSCHDVLHLVNFWAKEK